MKSIHYAWLLLLITSGLCAKKSATIGSESFLDKKLDEFMERVVPQEDHQSFREYYTEFMRKIGTIANERKREEQLVVLRQKARAALQVKHPQWSQELEPYEFYERTAVSLSEVNPKDVRVFLTRMGVWEEFLKDTAGQKATMWHRLKSYSKSMSHKVTGMFKRKKKEVLV